MVHVTSAFDRGGGAKVKSKRFAFAVILGVLFTLAQVSWADRFVHVARKAPARMHEAFAHLQSLADDGSSAEITVHPMQFLNEVNAWRREVGAPPLEWDAGIAGVAEEWASVLESEECELSKPTAEWTAEKYAEAGGALEPLGVNLAMACCETPAPQTGEQVVDMWAGEKAHYAFGPSGDACTVVDAPARPARRLLRAPHTAKLTLQPQDGPPIDPTFKDSSWFQDVQHAAPAAHAGDEGEGGDGAGHGEEEAPEEDQVPEEEQDEPTEEEDLPQGEEEEDEHPEEHPPVEESDEEREETQEEPEQTQEEPEQTQEEPEQTQAEPEQTQEEPEQTQEEPEETEEEPEEEPEETEEEREVDADGLGHPEEDEEEHPAAEEEEKEGEEEHPEEDTAEHSEPNEEEEKEEVEHPEAEQEGDEHPEEGEAHDEEDEDAERDEEEDEEDGAEPGVAKAGAGAGGGLGVSEYTQMVWAGTERMGCAVAACGDKGTVWVCAFHPAGNVPGELPFCRSNLPAGMPECEGLPDQEQTDAQTPCEQPQGSCGFDAECCSCGEAEAEEERGEEEEREGEEDSKEGEEMEKQGELKGDEEEEEEGKEEQKEGEEEEKEGEKEAEEGKGEAEEEEEEKEKELKAEAAAKAEKEVSVVVHLLGVTAEEFDAVKFQEVVAESLSLPLFKVTVGHPSASKPAARRRLLGAELYVPVTLGCEAAQCGELESTLSGLECNGELAGALSTALGAQVQTGCPEDEGQQHPHSEEEEEEEEERPEEAAGSPEEAAAEAREQQDEQHPAAAHAPRAQPEDEEDAEEAAGRVTFPDAFPNSVRHWLLIGMLMMFVGLVVTFVFTFVPSREMPMPHVLCFIMCGVAMCAYYCMWAGVAVQYKTTDDTPRVIFYAKYLDWILTAPLIVVVLALLANAKAPVMVALVGNALLFVLCMLVGATLVAPYKYMWWVFGMVFYLVLLLILFRAQRKSASSTLRTLAILTFLAWTLYPFLWLLGMEGTGALGLSQQVALTAMVDVLAKVVFSIIVVTSPQEPADEDEEERVMRTRFSSVM